jgi:hypothetical protein
VFDVDLFDDYGLSAYRLLFKQREKYLSEQLVGHNLFFMCVNYVIQSVAPIAHP